MNRVEYIIIGIVVVLSFVGFGTWKYVDHQNELKQQEISAQQAALAQKAQEQQQQAQQAAQKQSELTQAKNTESSCINDVNNQVSQAIQNGTAAGLDTVSPDLQVQQSGIAECQATYNASVNQISAN